MNRFSYQHHLAQLELAWSKTRSLKYHDIRLRNYVETLDSLFVQIKNQEVEESFSPDDVNKRIIDFFFENIDFIDSSNINSIPFEIVFCLDVSLKNWIDNFDYIIVTALRRDINSYSIYMPDNENIYKLIDSLYNIRFNHRLIQLNIPKYFARDYLANVVLYHEIGHFVDNTYHISETIYIDILNEEIQFDNIDVSKYLVNIKNVKKEFEEKDLITLYHLKEYISDIFAAQYIGECSCYYLDYIANNADFSRTHPSTSKRCEIVRDFIVDENSNELIRFIKRTISRICGKNICIRHNQLLPTDFLNLVPVEIENDDEMHSIFILGWELWQNKRVQLQQINNFQYNLEPINYYHIINNLIEKSIGNYMVIDKWTKAKANVSN
jgi:hypothetical protein